MAQWASVGAIQDGIYGDYSILAAKAILDLIIVFIMTASMGKGCILSAIPVGIFQGLVTLLARLIEPFMTEAALSKSFLCRLGAAVLCRSECRGTGAKW